jgi:nicotinamidase-related amidase
MSFAPLPSPPSMRCDRVMPEDIHPALQALIVMDVQVGFDDLTFWGPTTNPQAEDNVGLLIDHWRETGRGPVVVVRHDSRNPMSPLHPTHDGNRLKDVAAAAVEELLVTKQVNSAFYGEPDLHGWLTGRGIRAVTICGLQTNMCVETTARMAGNLGYETTVALDATRTFDITTRLPDGQEVALTADELMHATAVNLHGGGFATVTTTHDIVTRMPAMEASLD